MRNFLPKFSDFLPNFIPPHSSKQSGTLISKGIRSNSWVITNDKSIANRIFDLKYRAYDQKKFS
jgi:hypothetical protein